MIATIKLSVRQVLEALDDTNRFYASRFYNQAGETLTTEQLLAHYIAHAEIAMTVVGFNVEPARQTEGWGCKTPVRRHNHLERHVPFTLDLCEHEMEYAGAD